jgi:two-component system sensor histidine kinase/response regulator
MENLDAVIAESFKKYKHNSINEICQFVCEFITSKTEATRASIWFYNEDKDAIICQHLIDKRNNESSRGATLNQEDFESYFEGLEKGETIIADNARGHEFTEVFTELYFEPNDIYSLLDTPIKLDGETIGVVCCEHCGEFRSWTQFDIGLSRTLASELGKFLAEDGS